MSNSYQLRSVREQWQQWIDPAYTDPLLLAKQLNKFGSNDQAVLCLRDFWLRDKLKKVELALMDARWSTLRLLKCKDQIKVVDEEDFNRSTPELQFCRHEVISQLSQSDISTEYLPALCDFMAFVNGIGMASWMSLFLQVKHLTANSLEFSRYGEGDFINWHTDCLPGRYFNVVSYLDQNYQDKCQGKLLIQDRQKKTTIVKPLFNQLVILKITEDNRHRVESWKSSEKGRLGLSISFG